MITKEQLQLIKEFEGFYGDVSQMPKNQLQLKQFIGDWKFSWQMMHDAEDIEEFEWIDGLILLEELEKTL